MTWILGCFTRRVRSLQGDVRPAQLPKRVICTKFIGLGSVVLSLPLLKAFKDAGVQVAFWSFPGQAEIARLSGLVDEIWVIRPKLRYFLGDLWRTWRKSRNFGAEAFLDMEPTANFTAILARLSGVRLRIGFMSAKPVRERIFTHLVAQAPERHMIENNLWMGRLLGISSQAGTSLPKPPSIEPLAEPARESSEAALSRQTGRRRIVLNINSSDLSWHRMWPEQYWVELCQKLLEDPKTDLIFPGSPEERVRVDSLTRKLPQSDRILNMAGRTSLRELLGLLKSADLVVSVDSGIMHLAAWMGVPLLGMFGPETPRLYAPRSPKARVLWAALPCSPCLSVAADKITRCLDNQCMKSISSDRVYVASQSLLQLAAAVAASAPAAAPTAPEVPLPNEAA